MNPKVPRVTGKLREETLAFAADPQKIVDRCFEAIAQGEGNYARLSSSTRKDVVESVTQSAALWFDAILTGQAPRASVVEQFSLFGRKRLHQGISLTAVLGAFRIGSRELWNSYLAVAAK